MAQKREKSNGWTDKRSTYKTTTKGGRVCVKGEYCYCDQVFAFTANEQEKGDYILRGQVVMRSPQDGHRMEVRGKERRARMKALGSDGGRRARNV